MKMGLSEKELLILSKEIADTNQQLAEACNLSVKIAGEYRKKQMELVKICLDIYKYWLNVPSLTEEEKKLSQQILDVISENGLPSSL